MWCILFLCSSHQFWFPFSRVNTEVRLILKRRQEGGNSILFWIQDLTTTKNEVFETNISKLKRWTYYVYNEKIGKKSSNKKGKTTPYFRIQVYKIGLYWTSNFVIKTIEDLVVASVII